jgi:hypothetical protein
MIEDRYCKGMGVCLWKGERECERMNESGKKCFTGVQYFSKSFKLLFFMAIYCSSE